MSENRATKKQQRRTQIATTSKDGEDWPPLSQASQSSSPVHEIANNEADATSLHVILSEIKDFRRDNNQQLMEIKQEIQKTNNRLEEAESRIEETEVAVQAISALIQRLIQRQTTVEAKLTDQEGRARRDNLRVSGIPESEEGEDICSFVEELLRGALDFSEGEEIRVERAHRVRAARAGEQQARPRAIIAKLASYKVKEEVIRRAWQKKTVLYKNIRFFVDHDYPAAVQKRRLEYTEVKKVLKERKIKFQAPYPAKLRVHYEDGVQLYQSATEATEDMVSRGLPVTIIPRPADKDHRELLLSTWQVVGNPTSLTRSGEVQREGQELPMTFKEKLQEFKRNPSTKK